MLSKTRSTIIALVAAFSFTASVALPAVSQADTKAGESTGKGCTYTTPSGTKLQYNDKDKITIQNPNTTNKDTYECQNGKWVWVSAMVRPGASIVGPTFVGGTLVSPESTPSTRLPALQVASSPSAAL
jgi:hypothetical protein